MKSLFRVILMARAALLAVGQTTAYTSGTFSTTGTSTTNGTGTTAYPVRIAVIGDWGANFAPYNLQQAAVAAAMARWAGNGSHPLSFVASTGDNFYNSGVKSPSDTLWTSYWQNVYLQYPSLNVPWHAVLGNHDYCGSILAPVQYNKRGWQMLGMQYVIKLPLDANHTGWFLFVDTNPCVPEYTDAPECAAQRANVAGQSCSANGAWLREQLEAAAADETASWVVVFGHHNVGSNSFTWVEQLAAQPRLRVAAVFSGHTHCLAHERQDDVDYFISGAGSRVDCDNGVPSNTCNNNNCLLNGTRGVAGFLGVEIFEDRMRTHFIDQNGLIREIIETLVPPPHGRPVTPNDWAHWFTTERVAFVSAAGALFIGAVVAFAVIVFRRRRRRNGQRMLDEQREALLDFARERRASRGESLY
eukprot:TRINITY_DN1850_c0_g1_i1.p1 TRINITY_DN1850_c0_g1~~TRINITY_DN1850_c0_g1_i1.p1  ORF type:complete len:416 (+),score=152.55 TRINITY_DN1850_c0_g1_i1:182-1429(+)